MSTTPEGKVKAQVKKILDAHKIMDASLASSARQVRDNLRCFSLGN